MTTARAQAQTAQLKADRDLLYRTLVDLTTDLDDHLTGKRPKSLWRSVTKALHVIDQMEGRPAC